MNRRKRMIASLLIIIMAVTALPYHIPTETVEAAESTYVDTIQDETVLVDNDFSSYPEYDEWLATQIFGEGNYVFGHGGTDATISIEEGKLRIVGDDGGSATDGGTTINRTQFLLANNEEISEKGVLIECEYTINEGTTNAFAFASKPIVQGASYIEANDIWYAGVYTNKVRAALRCTDLSNAWIPIQDNTGANCYTIGTTYNLMVEVTPTAGVNIYAKAPGDTGYVKKSGLGISKMDTQFANAIAATNTDGSLKYPNAANASFAECLEDNVRLIVQYLCDVSIDNLKVYLSDQAGVDDAEKTYLFNEDFDGEEYSREAYGKWLAEEIFGEGNYRFGQGTQDATMYMENGALRIIGDNYTAPTDGRTWITKSQFLLSDNASISERGAIIEFDYTLNEGSDGYFALASKPLVEGASGIDANDIWISGIWSDGYRTCLRNIENNNVWNKPGYATTASTVSATSTTYKIKIEALPQETIKLSVMQPNADTYTALHNLTLAKMLNNFGTTSALFDKCFDDNLRLIVASNCDVTIDNLKITKANASEVVYENDFSSSSIASLQDDYLAKAISGDRNFIRTSGTTLAIENGALRITGNAEGSGITQLLIASDDRIAERGAVIECDYTLNEGSANTFAFASKPLASSNIYNQENWISGILASGHFASLMDTGATKWYTPGRYFNGASYASYSQTSTTYNLRLEVTPMNYLRLYGKTSDATDYTLLANLTKTQLIKYPDVSFANCLDGNVRLLVYDKCDVTIDNLKVSLAPLPKDSNYDEKVDILDLIRMKKAIANSETVIDIDVSDVDPDQAIDNDDVTALRDYLTTGITEFTGGTYVDTYACGNETEQYYYTEVDATTIDTYVDELRTNGYVKQQDNTIGSNRYVTLVGEKGLVHLTYLDYNQSLAVVKDALENTVYKGSEPKYTNVTNTTLAVMSLNYNGEGRDDTETNANGECFIVTLRDGRYVIVDGGYGCDAEAIYNFLKDNNKRSDGIKVAAWFLSHAHEDHYGAFAEFANTYNAEVSVEYVVAAEGASSMYSGGYSNWLATKLSTYMNKFGAKQIRPHAGQTLKFCDAKFNILYTGENYLNNAEGNLLTSENNASLVFQMVADSKKVLFTNDADKQVSELLVDMYGTNLQSTILQVNHHGYSGAISEFVQNVNPTYSLWATNQTSYELRIDPYAFVIGRDENDVADLQSHNGMQYLLTLMGDNNEKCFVADDDVEIIQLNNMTIKSYTPIFTTETTE